VALILVVEDQAALNDLIRTELESEGHRVVQAHDGPTALNLVREETPQLVILDWMLPGLDGLSVCRQLRRDHLMPIIMLTARAEEVDRVLGLEVGADDYLVKPFGMRELMARTRAALRRVELDARVKQPAAAGGKAIVIGGLRIEPDAHRVHLDGVELTLTPKEFEILLLFASNPGRAFNREFLIDRVWGGAFEGYDRAVDNHIRRLRQKLGAFGEKITTVYAIGYRLIP
jgi:DNA-binding response OmpR family regulator